MIVGVSLIEQAATQVFESQEGVTVAQLFSGSYVCNEEEGCAKITTLILEDDTTYTLSYSDDESGEKMISVGTWGVGAKNSIVLFIQKDQSLRELPRTLHGTIDSLFITSLFKKKQVLDWMTVNPFFKRVSP
jgi:hypothetical protein